jgi:hypothetical protein
MKKLRRRKVDSDDIHNSSVDIHMSLIMRQNGEIYRLRKESTHLRPIIVSTLTITTLARAERIQFSGFCNTRNPTFQRRSSETQNHERPHLYDLHCFKI